MTEDHLYLTEALRSHTRAGGGCVVAMGNAPVVELATMVKSTIYQSRREKQNTTQTSVKPDLTR